jgi:hypothetical protein
MAEWMTVSEIRDVFGIAERTTRSAATGGPLKGVSRQSGKTWLINVDTPECQAWLSRPEQTRRGKGKPRGSGRTTR